MGVRSLLVWSLWHINREDSLVKYFNARSKKTGSKISQILLLIALLTGFSCWAAIQSQAAFTPEALLLNAIKAGQFDDVRMLIENGTSVNFQTNDGVTPLHIAVINNEENIVALLLQAGAKVNAPDATTLATPLHLAALYGREKIAVQLLQKGADVTAKMKFGITPLLVAAQFGQSQIIQLFIAKKADLNITDQEGFTALHFAAQNGDEIVTHMLLENGANVNLYDKINKVAPITLATQNNHPNVARMLKEHGAKD